MCSPVFAQGNCLLNIFFSDSDESNNANKRQKNDGKNDWLQCVVLAHLWIERFFTSRNERLCVDLSLIIFFLQNNAYVKGGQFRTLLMHDLLCHQASYIIGFWPFVRKGNETHLKYLASHLEQSWLPLLKYHLVSSFFVAFLTVLLYQWSSAGVGLFDFWTEKRCTKRKILKMTFTQLCFARGHFLCGRMNSLSGRGLKKR